MTAPVVLPNAHERELPVDAACRGVRRVAHASEILFFIIENCRQCPVTAACLSVGLMNPEADGVYGGVLLAGGEPETLEDIIQEAGESVADRRS